MIRRAKYKFRLYIAGNARNSLRAVANLIDLCKKYLPQRYEIEIVDVFEQGERALEDGILMTPTLVKDAPAPVQKIVGTLSQTEFVLQVLGVEPTRHELETTATL
jgi:circadian clock protein KaiB